MAAYSLSSRAAADFEEIYEFTIDRFGLQQARTYLTGLSERFDAVAQNPMLGRDASELSPGLRRLVYQSHVVFYVATDLGVRVIRVLHQSMDVARHL